VAEFFGETFELPDRFNMRLFTRFGTLAKKGVDSEDIEGVAMIDQLINQCLRPEDVDRFDEVCDRERPDFDELMEFVMGVVAEVTERPTKRPSDSSDGPTPTKPSSPADSSLRVIHRLEEEGRPSIALMVQQREQQKASSVSA
jgi:hypothetical protein